MRTILNCAYHMKFPVRSILVKSAQAFAVSAASLMLSVSASAFQPLTTDDTGMQASGGNQVEFSLNEDRAKALGKVELLRSLPIVYTRGLTDALDVFTGLSYAWVRPASAGSNASGSGSPSFGAKWRFFAGEESKTSFALKPEVLLPAGDDRDGAGLGTGKTSGRLTLILTRELPFGAIHINAGVSRDRYRNTLNNPDTTTKRFSIAPVWDLKGQWKLAFDLGAESAYQGDAKIRSNSIQLGAIYSPSKDLDFALGALCASDNASPRTNKRAATAGITWRFR